MTYTRSRRFVLLTAVAVGLLACARKEPKEFVQAAKFGVFYGGQVEERRELPFELDPSKQTQGFRVVFSAPLSADTPVDFRIDMPKTGREHRTRKQGAAEPPRTTLSGTDIARAGETMLDHPLEFHPGDPLGVWNVRVVVKGKVVIDRPVEVFDPAERKRLERTDAG